MKAVFDLKHFSVGGAIRLLQLLLGIQLLVLAIHNKLLDPGLALVFIDNNEFTNVHFVFSAGIAEAVFGVLLIANISQRFVISVGLNIFYDSGVNGLVGHLPIFGIAAVLWLHPQKNLFFERRVVAKLSPIESPA